MKWTKSGRKIEKQETSFGILLLQQVPNPCPTIKVRIHTLAIQAGGCGTGSDAWMGFWIVVTGLHHYVRVKEPSTF